MAKKKSNGKQTDLRKIPKDKRPKPTTGQSADERELPYDSLNDDELEVIRMLNGSKSGGGPRVVRTIEFLAEGLDSKLAVRNALRRLVSCGWVDRAERGKYQVSERGRKRMQRL
jgi:hypothetical protein